MLVTEMFLKDIKSLSNDKRNKIIQKLKYFEDELKANSCIIRKLNSGFWVIGLENGVYKFRLNIKDRILFRFIENRDKISRNKVQFLRYVNHDEQIRVAKEMTKEKDEVYIDNEIIETKEEAEVDKVYLNEILGFDIIGVLIEEEEIFQYLDNDSFEFLYYLSDEQYKVVSDLDNKSIILKGAGGTGKTVVLLNKLLGIKKISDLKVGYITYTELLADKVQKLYDEFSQKTNVKFKGEFYHIRSLYKYLAENENYLISSYEAIEWINNNRAFYQTLKKVSSYDIYSEISGVIKGFLGLEGENISKILNSDKYILVIDEYLEIPNKCSIFTIEQKKEIHRFANKYNKWLRDNNFDDENDLALKVIKSNKIKFDYIVVDEIQDLSELQIYMISTLVKNERNIIWAGDFHQTVNPTFFEFFRLKNIYYGQNNEIKEFVLTKNFRSNREIIKLFNHLSEYRKIKLGAKEDILEIGVREGECPQIIKPIEENIIKVLENIENKVYSAIVVADEEDKKKLIKINPSSKGRIFTVFEIKGLEYENIYTYNIISKNLEHWWKIFSGNVKNQMNMRYYFNLFYVAISRARDYLFIYEESLDKLPNDFLNFEIMNMTSTDELKLSKKSGEKDINLEIEKLIKAGNIAQANSLIIHQKISANEIRELISFFKVNEGYNCLIYDGNYINTCIYNNYIELEDIQNDTLILKSNKDICNECLYSQHCVLGNKSILNISMIESITSSDVQQTKLIRKLNNRLNIFLKEVDKSIYSYIYQAEIFDLFDKYDESIFCYTKIIESKKLRRKILRNAFYCRSKIYEKNENLTLSNQDKLKWEELL